MHVIPSPVSRAQPRNLHAFMTTMLRIPPDDSFVTKVEKGRAKFAERFPCEYAWIEHMARQAILPINWDRRSWEDLPKMAQLAVLDEIRDSVASYMRWKP